MSNDTPADLPVPHDVSQLDDMLSTPTPRVLETLRQLSGDVMILGVGGKMGPTLARMVRRAVDASHTPRRVIGVSRFSSPELPHQLAEWGVESVACDLLDEESVARLPDAPLVISMAGFKFGASSNPSLTWAMNCYLPAVICRRFRQSRIVTFSSGNVYGLVPVASGGSVETDEPRPVGEYAVTVLGRERILDYFSRRHSQPMAILRLNYATELRYGVLVDIGQKVWNRQPVDVTMGHVNVIWQTEANAMAICALAGAEAPARIFNIAGPEILSIRDVAESFGRCMQRDVQLTGAEGEDALLNNARASYAQLGTPRISAEQMIRWTAAWIMRGGATSHKPTHFESRDGTF